MNEMEKAAMKKLAMLSRIEFNPVKAGESIPANLSWRFTVKDLLSGVRSMENLSCRNVSKLRIGSLNILVKSAKSYSANALILSTTSGTNSEIAKIAMPHKVHNVIVAANHLGNTHSLI